MNAISYKQFLEPYRWRKGFIVEFIFFFLFCESLDNLHITFPPADNAQTLQGAIYRGFKSQVSLLWQIGLIFSIAEHWTMYTFANPTDQQLLILGVDQTGHGVVLPIPSQSSRNFLESNLIDYHENKMLEGTWKYPLLREMIASSMCRLYGKKYHLKSILFVQILRRILPWDEALTAHRHYDLHTTEFKYGEYPCKE
jgi:hypothetical protein